MSRLSSALLQTNRGKRRVKIDGKLVKKVGSIYVKSMDFPSTKFKTMHPYKKRFRSS